MDASLFVKCEHETHTMQVASGTPWETVMLTTLSQRPCARDSALRGQEGHRVVHIVWGTEWRPFGLPRCKWPLHSAVLTPGIMVNR
ncbi:hypothetical protein F5888DRAFT_1747156 [Russula emetica]|nr:hypothetical protein F5888DRAFT_1747156 [Russula emetica]